MGREFASEPGSTPIRLWACVLCGHRTDDTIRFHRAYQSEETQAQRHDRIMREYRAELALLPVPMEEQR